MVRYDLKTMAIASGFQAFHITGAHRLLRRLTGAIGAVLMMHHVRPEPPPAFAPNQALVITPTFLANAIRIIRNEGFEIIDLDQALRRVATSTDSSRFVVLTFDDGYRDFSDHALPVLRRLSAPFTIYVTPGFIERRLRP